MAYETVATTGTRVGNYKVTIACDSENYFEAFSMSPFGMYLVRNGDYLTRSRACRYGNHTSWRVDGASPGCVSGRDDPVEREPVRCLFAAQRQLCIHGRIVQMRDQLFRLAPISRRKLLSVTNWSSTPETMPATVLPALIAALTDVSDS